MFKLKEFYQQKRDLFKTKRSLHFKLLKRVRKMDKLSFPVKKELFKQKTRKSVTTKTKIKRKNLAILYVSSSLNNTFVTLTDLKGKVRHVRSAGLCGFQGKKKRSTKFAVKSILNSVTRFAKDSKVTGLFLCLKGFSKPRRYVLNALKAKKLRLLGVRDLTPNPHNGCRLRKKRRV